MLLDIPKVSQSLTPGGLRYSNIYFNDYGRPVCQEWCSRKSRDLVFFVSFCHVTQAPGKRGGCKEKLLSSFCFSQSFTALTSPRAFQNLDAQRIPVHDHQVNVSHITTLSQAQTPSSHQSPLRQSKGQEQRIYFLSNAFFSAVSPWANHTSVPVLLFSIFKMRRCLNSIALSIAYDPM